MWVSSFRTLPSDLETTHRRTTFARGESRWLWLRTWRKRVSNRATPEAFILSSSAAGMVPVGSWGCSVNLSNSAIPDAGFHGAEGLLKKQPAKKKKPSMARVARFLDMSGVLFGAWGAPESIGWKAFPDSDKSRSSTPRPQRGLRDPVRTPAPNCPRRLS